MESVRPVNRILIVDDEPSVLHLLEIGLSRLNCELHSACSGEAGLAAARELSPVLVVLDILMPDIDGYEVCRRFRQFSTEPVILLSALRDRGDLASALAAGADEFVAKPFSMADLLGRCRSALARRLPPPVPDKQLPPFGGGRYSIDLERRLVYEVPRRRPQIPGVVPVSNTGFRLLTHLSANKGRRLTYADAIGKLWGPAFTGERELLRAHLSVLRKTLEPDLTRPRIILDDGEDVIQFVG